LIKHPSRERDRQPALCLDRLRIERQRVLEKADRLCIDIARIRLKPGGAAPENVVQCVGMLGRSGSLRCDQLNAERIREPARDLVL
jgi:hypothetical protein